MVLLPSWLLCLKGAQGQDISALDMRIPIVSEAWEAGCLNRDELAALSAALSDSREPRFTQQELAALLNVSRVNQVLDCLLEIPSWRAFFSLGLRKAVRTEATSIILAMQTSTASMGQGVHSQIAVRHRDGLGMSARLRGRWDGVDPTLDIGSMELPLRSGRLHVGRLSGRFGQGLLLWTPGPFDALGGMEGSHRIEQGLSGAAFLLRGVQEGVGWERNKGLGFEGPGWMILGRSWPDRKYSVAMGGGKAEVKWALRAVERLDARWTAMAGLDGGLGKDGWSIRWALAAFCGGWDGRLSMLQTWSRHWEAHVMLEREDPANPRFWNGELNGSLPPAGAQPEWKCNAGVAFDGAIRGWIRTSVQGAGHPPFRLRRKTALRLEQQGHRLDFKTDWQSSRIPSEAWHPLDLAWSMSWRKSGHPDLLKKWQWRVEVVFVGNAEARGAAAAWTMQGKTRRGGRLRWGVGESWGNQGAPVRYLHGWNGRPVMPFSGLRSRAYFHWATPRGKWRFELQLSMTPTSLLSGPENPQGTIHAFRVEFRPPPWPHRRR